MASRAHTVYGHLLFAPARFQSSACRNLGTSRYSDNEVILQRTFPIFGRFAWVDLKPWRCSSGWYQTSCFRVRAGRSEIGESSPGMRPGKVAWPNRQRAFGLGGGNWFSVLLASNKRPQHLAPASSDPLLTGDSRRRTARDEISLRCTSITRKLPSTAIPEIVERRG